MENKVLLLGGSGLVGRTIAAALQEACQVIPTAGHCELENGYRLRAEEPERLLEILEQENPELVISSIRGNYQAQLSFHRKLADWLAGKGKRLLYISTANVFDGDLSRPWTEDDPPVPESEYGVFKRDCEAMLCEALGDRLIIFRLGTVWDFDCPRVRQLEEHSRSGEPHHTYSGDMVNISYTGQIGAYARYVLGHDLHGVFHVGTTDMADYFEFEKMVCEALEIQPPEFEAEKADPTAFQAILPARKEIPDELQMTIEQVVAEMKQQKQGGRAGSYAVSLLTAWGKERKI